MTEDVLDTKELVDLIVAEMRKNARRSKKLPTFTYEEALFILRLIFEKSKDLAFITTVDHISQQFPMTSFLNSPSYRRERFFRYYMGGSNAAQAAIAAGYSHKAAKQQGYRVVKWLQEHQND